ncbi:MAG: DUF502 domain-containing protein [Woeseiaceae bacterium]
MKRIRRYLVAGILVWAPLAVTYLLLKFAVNIMDRTLRFIPADLRPEILLQQLLGSENPVHIPGLGIILALTVLLLTGFLAANFVGRAFVGGWEALMHRIPIVRSIYSGAKHFAEMVFSDSSQSFKNVLLIEYPRKGLYSLAFQTSSELGEVQGRTGEDVVCCFVPTTPNPTSGFIIIVPRKDITVLDMEVDEALRMIISLGVVIPSWRKGQTRELPIAKPDEPA